MKPGSLYFFLGLFPFLSHNLSAQESLSISSSKQQLIIGDSISVRIRATYKREPIRSFPTFKLLVGKQPFEWLKSVPTDTVFLENGNLQISTDFILTSFEPGSYTLGPIKLLSSSQPSGVISSNSIPVKVLPLPLERDSVEIKPIRDIWIEQRSWQDWLSLFYFLSGIIFLVLLVLWLIKKKKKKISTSEPLPEKVPPAREALEKMEWLSKQTFLEDKDFVNFHYELGIIFRTFLEKQFDLRVLDLPSTEVLEKIQNLPFASLMDPGMFEWMKTADFIKFAKLAPPLSFHEAAFSQVKQFLTQFLPQEGAPASENQSPVLPS
jgi:hypothetical protein